MILGLDLHGVITANPALFSSLSKTFMENGHDVHIITGRSLSKLVEAYLKDNKICYTKIFSITDYHIAKGTKIRYEDPDKPFIDYEVWDRTKAEYCQLNKIGIHIDDTEAYGEYFLTPFCCYDNLFHNLVWKVKEKTGCISLYRYHKNTGVHPTSEQQLYEDIMAVWRLYDV